ncbi:hypothetical protein SK128_008518 [Halocaridina rubra]|uniref:Nephrin/kirre n=1 Tax=Halocaridina rubra TaxID=373956 RepID=A0AAN8ZSU5_HALRR
MSLFYGDILMIISIIVIVNLSLAASYRGIWRRVEAVSGREAVLPCEVGPIDHSDKLYVVLWYRNSDKEPIYSYDNRPGRLQASEDRHTIKSPALYGRVTFRPGLIPALHIKPVMRSDEANYTCRADFRIATSRRTHLRLHVVVPPEVPILRVAGQRITEGILGPLQEGSPLVITCDVIGGTPPPTVVWMRHKKIIDSQIESYSPSMIENQLSILSLTREFHNAKLTCLAANNNVTAPVQATIVITMNYSSLTCTSHFLPPVRPLITRLDSPPKVLQVGREYDITCFTAGSRPHTNITWTLGNMASFTSITPVTEHGINITTSTVKVMASRRYHGQRLTCTAVNPYYSNYPLADSILLNVTYPPVATIELGRGVSSNVQEGEDIYFNCHVDANPPTYKISWYHKGSPVKHSPEEGVLLTKNSLALRDVTRTQAGPYVCSAYNVEGDAHSHPLNLTVNYAPICSEKESSGPPRVYAAGIGQYINVSCIVLASPSKVKYSWVFNNSVTSQRLPGDQVFTAKDGSSIVSFQPQDPNDYGTLQCWAQNSVGRMTTPCLFHIVPAGRPESPVGCRVSNKTYDTLTVTCTPGFNGGLEQSFLAKAGRPFSRVFEAVTGRSQLNVTSEKPRFFLEGLIPGLDYTIQVRAKNIIGESPPVRLEAFTYKMAENRMRDEQVEKPPQAQDTFAGALVASAIGTTVTVLLVGITIRCLWSKRRRRREREAESQDIALKESRQCLPPDKAGTTSENTDTVTKSKTLHISDLSCEDKTSKRSIPLYPPNNKMAAREWHLTTVSKTTGGDKSGMEERSFSRETIFGLHDALMSCTLLHGSESWMLISTEKMKVVVQEMQ